MSAVGLILVTLIGAFILATALYSSGEMALVVAIGSFVALTFLKPELLFEDVFAIQGVMYFKVITILFGYVWYLAGYVFGNVAKWILGIALLGVFLWSQGIHSISDIKNAIQLSSGLVFWLVRG
ncbi:hypothetical protein [Thermococcus sp.]|uniref:hypothetical protein n=1 Tax=Thermococcus sp. TaxID=35749 RepID=UPI0025EFE283|nr:hypothetical protein [Thermococcus sp.]